MDLGERESGRELGGRSGETVNYGRDVVVYETRIYLRF